MPKRRPKPEPGLANENTKVKRKNRCKGKKTEPSWQHQSYELRRDSDSEGDYSSKENENAEEGRAQSLRPRSERLRTKRVMGEQNPGKRVGISVCVS